jgi:hypothetical protein
MIHVFGIQRVMAFVRSGPRKSPPAPDTQVDGDRDTYHQQGAETEDDKPPDHPHD